MAGKIPIQGLLGFLKRAPRPRFVPEPEIDYSVEVPKKIALLEALARKTPAQGWIPFGKDVEEGLRGFVPLERPLGPSQEMSYQDLLEEVIKAREMGYAKLQPTSQDRYGGWHQYGGDIEALATDTPDPDPVRALERILRRNDSTKHKIANLRLWEGTGRG